MSEFVIELEGGTAVRLPTTGKFCDKDIVIHALGGGELPSGVGYLASGTFTPSQDTEGFEIETGLTREPSFYIVMATSDVSSVGEDGLQSQFYFAKQNQNGTPDNYDDDSWYFIIEASGGNDPQIIYVRQQDDDPEVAAYMFPAVGFAVFISRNFWNRKYFKAGKTYRWLAGHVNGFT